MTEEATPITESPAASTRAARYPSDLIEFVQEASIGVAILSAEGRPLWANRAVYEGLGYSREEFFRTDCANWFWDRSEGTDILKRLFGGEVLKSIEVRLRDRGGEERRFVLDGDTSANGELRHARLLLRDVTSEVRSAREVQLQTRMLDAVGQAVIATDRDGLVTYWNRAAEEMFGWNQGEARGRSVFELIVPPGDGEREAFRELRRGRSWSGEFVLRRKDGSLFPAFVTDTPIRDMEGKALGFIGVLVDMSSQKAAEAALAESRELYRLVVDNAVELITITDTAGHIRFASPSHERVWGHAPGELAGRHLTDLFHEDDLSGLLQALARARESGQPEEFRARLGKTGKKERVVEGTALPVAGPGQGEPLVLLIYREITAQLDAEKDLRARERKIEALADSLPAIVAIGSRGVGFYYFNKAWYEFTGFDPEDATNRPWQDVVHPDDYRHLREWMDVVLSGRTVEQEVRARRHDGVYRWFLVRVVPLAPLGDDPGSVVVTAVDVTELKDAQQRSESAKNQLETVLRAIGDGVTAHDLSGRILYANEAAARLIGVASVEELLASTGEQLLQRFHIEDANGRMVPIEELPGSRAARGEPTAEELLCFRDAAGTDVRYALVSAAPIRDAQGNIEFVVDVFREVTDRVRADAEREELLRRETQARVAAERAVARASALQELTARLLQANTQRDVAEVMVTQGMQVTGAAAVAVAMLDGEEAVIAASRGFSGRTLRRGQRFALSDGQPLARALQAGQELYMSCSEVRQQFPHAADAWYAGAVAAAPVSATDLRGAVCFLFEEERTLSADEKDMVRTLATLCAQAMDRARLYELERYLRREAQESADLLHRVQLVTDAALAHPDLRELPQMLDVIREVVGSDTITMLLMDDDGRYLVPVASLGLEEEVALGQPVEVGRGFSGTIAASGEPMILDDLEREDVSEILRRAGLVSLAGIPLVVEGKVTGVLRLGMRGEKRFHKGHIRLLELVADRVALAFAQSRLFEEERRSREAAERTRERVSRLQTVTASLAGATTPAEVAEAIVDSALDALQASSAVVVAVEDSGELRRLAARGISEDALETWSKVAGGRTATPIREVIETGEPVFITRPREFRERYSGLEQYVDPGNRAIACMPLKASGRTLGALALVFREERALGDDDRDFLASMVQQGALALARVQLYEAERRARAAAEDAEARYRLLAETMPLLVWTARPDGSVDYCNARFYEYTGLRPGGDGEGWLEAVHRADSPAVREAWRRSLESGEAFEGELRIRRADGSHAWFLQRVLPLRDAAGALVRWLGALTEIEDQKRSEQRLAFLAEASAILSSSLDYEHPLEAVAKLAVERLADWCSIHIVGDDGRVERRVIAHADEEKRRLAEQLEASEPLAAEGAFGYASVLRTARPFLIRRIPDPGAWPEEFGARRREVIRQLGIKSSLGVPVFVRGRVKAALTLSMSETDRLLDERDLATAEEFARHISFALDSAFLYRESVRAQEELRVANEAKDEFLGLMSHELRTPITTLYGGAKILRSRSRWLDDEHKESLLSDIENEAEGLHRMIEDLLVLARTGAGEKVATEPILANRLVEKVVRAFNLHRLGRTVEVRAEPDLLPVMADTTYLEQVLRNLLSNADKYSPPGAPIEVEMKNDGEEVVISVLDRGSGIEPEEAELIFNRFYRAERTSRGVRGMGLGLTVCRKLIEAQGGRIWAKPREGGGSELAFALPAFTASYDDTE
ncbi:MAG TPA: PAS domain S-box protein [Dehalococcoidia bacterium]|nr:PAS domain S-box protein [Dehalococcoidia bacterium]